MSAHVVVLAAGRGSRLGALGADTPKWLLDVGGRTLADRHLAGVALAATPVASVRVVTGHGAGEIERYLLERLDSAAPPVRLVANLEYATLNNWWSLLLALRTLPDDGAPVAVLNADLLVEPEWVAAFLDELAAARAEGLLAVDLQRTLTDESMKVSLRADGTLERIGKAGVADPAGEYIGMLAARGAVLRALRAALEAFVGDPEAANAWYEGAVGETARAGAAWEVWPTPGSGWVEIDDDDDLAAALALVAS